MDSAETHARATAWLEQSGVTSWMPGATPGSDIIASAATATTTEDAPRFELQEAASDSPSLVAPSALVQPQEPASRENEVAAPEIQDTVTEPAPEAIPTAAEVRADDPVEKALARARAYSAENKKVAALSTYRKIGESFGQDPRVLEGWSRAAVKTRGWGEALRVALRWAAVDETPTAQLYLARVQKQVGQRYGAIATIKRVLDRDPENKQGKALMDRYRGKRVAMLDN